MEVPSRNTLPPRGESSRITLFKIVDFPAPFGPMSVTMEPRLIFMEILERTGFLRYPTVRPSAVR